MQRQWQIRRSDVLLRSCDTQNRLKNALHVLRCKNMQGIWQCGEDDAASLCRLLFSVFPVLILFADQDPDEQRQDTDQNVEN